MKTNNVKRRLEEVKAEIDFSGTVYVKLGDHLFTESYGFANRSEQIQNQTNTRYGIASGCKFFTSIAICQLVEQGKLSFDTKLSDCLDIPFPHFEQNITIHHLLTHTSGIPDYFDEDEMDDYEELWLQRPMYTIRKLRDFLPLFQEHKMKSAVGSGFHYNNSGYIVLGLVIEQISGLAFSEYIERFIFNKVGMHDSGYFELDALPDRVALGYIQNPDGSYKTNIYSIPAKGGSDGGAYVTVQDVVRLWESLKNQDHPLLSLEMTNTLLAPRIQVEDDIFYGYGGFMQTKQDGIIKHILMGYDPGVNFRCVHYPDTGLTIVVCSNQSDGAYEMIKAIEDELVE